jgi:hypothetical protein
MKFSDIMNLHFEDLGGRPDYNSLKKLLPNVPEDVFIQFFYDHGRKSEFQLQYSTLEILNIKWIDTKLTVNELLNLSIYSGFIDWVETVENRAKKCNINNFNSIDIRKEVVKHWQNNYTWIKPPILILGNIINSSRKYHLVEGHTRIGTLKGLFNQGLLKNTQTHKVWLGKY